MPVLEREEYIEQAYFFTCSANACSMACPLTASRQACCGALDAGVLARPSRFLIAPGDTPRRWSADHTNRSLQRGRQSSHLVFQLRDADLKREHVHERCLSPAMFLSPAISFSLSLSTECLTARISAVTLQESQLQSYTGEKKKFSFANAGSFHRSTRVRFLSFDVKHRRSAKRNLLISTSGVRSPSDFLSNRVGRLWGSDWISVEPPDRTPATTHPTNARALHTVRPHASDKHIRKGPPPCHFDAALQQRTRRSSPVGLVRHWRYWSTDSCFRRSG
jgi:hypothetical protein